ncbi:MAG: hypothetical protein ACK4K0_04350 [Flavobacteriales bacterium]
MKKAISIGIFISACFITHSQIQIDIKTSGCTEKASKQLPKTAKDSLAAIKELERIRLDYIEKGYLEASFDSLKIATNTLSATLHCGESYTFAELNFDRETELLLAVAGVRNSQFRNFTLSPMKYRRLTEKIIEYYENHGYPFCSVKIDSIEKPDSKLKGKLIVNRGPRILVDSIVFKNEFKTNPQLITQHIDINVGSDYSEKTFANIGKKLKEVPYIQTLKPAEIEFHDSTVTLYLNIKDKAASLFNGVIGVLPDEATGKINITGDIKLVLKNALRRGETIDLNWRSIAGGSQDLRTRFNYPYLFKTKFGLDGRFNLFKRDSTFLELDRRIGVQYLFKSNTYLQVGFQNKESDIIRKVTVISANNLPNLLSSRSNSYALTFHTEKLDYIYNPLRGISIEITTAGGIKKFLLPADFDPTNLPSSIELTTNQFLGNIDFAGYIQIATKSTIKLGIVGSANINPVIFSNEMARFGGLKTLRGFDEESLSATSFAISTLEVRYLLEENSNVFAFLDMAWYEQKLIDGYRNDTPYGFGGGVSFQTGAGIFSVTYALGSQQGNPIILRTGKIHFGFINYF